MSTITQINAVMYISNSISLNSSFSFFLPVILILLFAVISSGCEGPSDSINANEQSEQLELKAQKTFQSQGYEITMTDLGTLGELFSIAHSINDEGQIVGWFGTRLETQAFLWEDGVMKDLGTFGDSVSKAYSINNHGDIVGTTRSANKNGRLTPPQSFLLKNGEFTRIEKVDIGLLATSSINEKGQIVGSGGNGKRQRIAAYWENGKRQKMCDCKLEGGRYSKAFSINNNSQIVGWSETSTFIGSHAFLWENGKIKDLGPGTAYGINNSEQVVGSNRDGAFLWEDGKVTSLGALDNKAGRVGPYFSRAFSINDEGQVVGYSGIDFTQDTRAVLWLKDGKIINLGTLGGSSSRAYSINNKGQIVGKSKTSTGAQHAVLWEIQKIE